MKIVVNRAYGGFGLSDEAVKFLGIEKEWLSFIPNHNLTKYCDYEMRTAPELIKCVETLGEKANGTYARLQVVEIPDNIEWEIEDYDGVETVAEKHRSW